MKIENYTIIRFKIYICGTLEFYISLYDSTFNENSEIILFCCPQFERKNKPHALA